MPEALKWSELFWLVGGLISVVSGYIAIKFQGIINSKEIKSLKESQENALVTLKTEHEKEINELKVTTEKQWDKIDEVAKSLNGVKERITKAIDMETAEKKFVTRAEHDIVIKQFNLDVKSVKDIAIANGRTSQNVLDAVQDLKSMMPRLSQ